MPTESNGTNAAAAQPEQARSSNNNNNNNQGQRRRNRGNRYARRTTFTGSDSSMNGHIYDVPTDKVSDQYIKTTKEVRKWVGRNFSDTYPALFMAAIDNMVMPALPVVNNPIVGDPMSFEIWKEDRKELKKAEKAYANFLASLYNLIMGQCTEALEDRIRSHIDFPTVNQNGLRLLEIVKQITHTYEEQTYPDDAIMSIKETFYKFQH